MLPGPPTTPPLATARDGLTYRWDFNNDNVADASGRTVTKKFRNAGRHKIALTVTDEAGNSETVGRTLLVRKLTRCRSDRVSKSGGWEVVQNRRANGGSFCRNDGDRKSRDVLSMKFRGPRIVVIHGDVAGGGRAAVLIDGERVGKVSFRGDRRRIGFGEKVPFTQLGKGRHTIRIVMQRGRGYVEGFTMRR